MKSFSVVLGAAVAAVAAGSPSCLDESGSPIAWFAAFKMPNGGNYAYYGDGSSSLTESSYSLTGSSGSIIGTVQQAADPADGVSVGAYNDEPGYKASTKYGHTKGVFAFDEGGGFYMVHSVPNWPLLDTTGAEYPTPQLEYGQSFLCVSLEYDDFDNLGLQFQLNRPDFYNTSLTSQAQSDLPNLADATTGAYDDTADSKTISLRAGGMTFTMFAKTAKWNNDLYSAFIAPTMTESLSAETWMRGDEIGASCDSSYTVTDIQDLNVVGTQWGETQDHSKWAVATSTRSSLVCICDINRMTSQYGRGGGGMCFHESGLAKSLRSSIVDYIDSCPSEAEGEAPVIGALRGSA